MKWSYSLLISTWILIALVFLSAGNPKISGRSTARTAISNLKIYWIDTEGGAATLIITPVGESILIDTGNPGNRDAERIFEVAVNDAGLKQIDHLVTTHWHLDHYGGAPELAKRIPIIEVINKSIPDKLSEDNTFADNIKAYKEMQVQKWTAIKPNSAINLKTVSTGLPELRLRFVGVDKEFFTAAPQIGNGLDCDSVADKAIDTSENANSMVLVMDYGPFRFFDGGDLTWNIEKILVCPQDLIGTIDVYQVNHHGLDQSNNPVLIKNLSPTVTIMNNGATKGCGPETIKTLRQSPSIQAAYQLHKNVRPDSTFNTQTEYIANQKKECKGNFISLEVAPDGKTYTVSIPANGHQQTFQTTSR